MSFRKIDNCFACVQGWIFKKVIFHISETKGYELRMSLKEFKRRDALSLTSPVCFCSIGERYYWQYNHQWYWENETLTPDEVYALIFSREHRNRLRVNRAKELVTIGTRETKNKRVGIPNDLKALVWERDEGMCVNCGSIESLQFDHIIPVAMGGATTAENLQLLCASCNIKKGRHLF